MTGTLEKAEALMKLLNEAMQKGGNAEHFHLGVTSTSQNKGFG